MGQVIICHCGAKAAYAYVETKIMDPESNGKSIIEQLFAKGKKLYHKTPNCLRWILWPATSIFKLIDALRLDLWIIVGDEISSRQKLTMIYAGREKNRPFLIELAFGSSYRENYIGKKWLWKIPDIARESNNDCSLMVMEVPKSFRILYGQRKCLYIPSWVSGEIDISSHTKSDSVKTDMRRIRKNNLHFEVTNGLSQFDDFYHNMHVPYIAKTFGNRAVIASYDFMRREFRKHGLYNDLLLIKREEEYIAGILLGYTKNAVHLHSVGVRDGNLDYVKDGAIGALFYFPAVYSKEKGYSKVNFGLSRAFLKDGVLQFKKKRGMQIVDASKIGFLIEVLSKTVGVKGFFLNNPFIYIDKMRFKAAIFVPSDQSFSREDFARIYKDYYLRGLSKLVIYRIGEANSGTWGVVPSEFSDTVAMCSADSIF